MAQQAQRAQHTTGIGARRIGEDELAAGQGTDGIEQLGMRGDRAVVDGVHGVEEMVGVDLMPVHEPVQRGAVGLVVALLQRPRLIEGQLRDLDDILGDQPVDLREEIAFPRIEGVVEVEDPLGHMREGTRSAWRHIEAHEPMMAEFRPRRII